MRLSRRIFRKKYHDYRLKIDCRIEELSFTKYRTAIIYRLKNGKYIADLFYRVDEYENGRLINIEEVEYGMSAEFKSLEDCELVLTFSWLDEQDFLH